MAALIAVIFAIAFIYVFLEAIFKKNKGRWEP